MASKSASQVKCYIAFYIFFAFLTSVEEYLAKFWIFANNKGKKITLK